MRELISNSSDALNKLRSAQVAGEADGALPLEINIATQVDDGTITIQDTGIGMTKDELIQNLGTIARSGSRQFINEMDDEEGTEDVTSSIIGAPLWRCFQRAVFETRFSDQRSGWLYQGGSVSASTLRSWSPMS